MVTQKRGFKFVFVSFLIGATLLACAPIASMLAPGKPVVSISSPAHGASVNLGQEVLVQAIAEDASGIVRVELWVDGALSTSAQSPSPQTAQTAVLRWTPNAPGPHMLTVQAINARNVASDPAAITVNVIAQNVPAAPPRSTVPLPAPATAIARAGDPYADRVVSFTPGNPAAPRFGDPKAVLGKPDFDKGTLSGFLTLGVGGSITVEFVDNIAVDGPGPDIEIDGDPDDDEMWMAEVSADCVNFKSFGRVRERVKLDLAAVGLTSARCVRLTDDGDPAGGISPGAELDAVLALNSAPAAQTAPSTSIAALAAPTGTLTRKPAVNATTLNGKVIFGYNGWFSCPNDGSRFDIWVHWTKDTRTFKAGDLKVDFWPDISELPADERCATDMLLPDGSTAQVYSSYNSRTIDRHFQWMEQYDIDGVAASRFVVNLDDPRAFDFRNQVLRHVRAAAEAHGRIFYVQYDSSGIDGAALVANVKKDWTYLVDVMRITESPMYLHDNGLPVLQIYGLGISNNPGTGPTDAQQIADYFKSTAPAKYRVTLIGGLPSYWRTGTRDAFAGPAWAAAYRSYDVISPWAVGRYANDAEADQYRREVIAPDLVETAQRHTRYMPVIFPGFSWTNMFPNSTLNQIPRQCGRFYWHQAFNAIAAGSQMIFVAMFDEMDEGTAMFKLAPTKAQLPLDAKLVPLDIDGCALPSDWYLRLGGATGKMLRGEIKLTPEIPIKPN